jgi:hypothetical protein
MMPRKAKKGRLYDDATKAAILKAAVEARAAGKTWPQALEDAKAAGYKGGVVSLMLYVRAASKGKRKPGRPAKKRGRPAKAAAAPAAQVGSIEALIDRIVEERVGAALEQAIAVLQKIRRK